MNTIGRGQRTTVALLSLVVLSIGGCSRSVPRTESPATATDSDYDNDQPVSPPITAALPAPLTGTWSSSTNTTEIAYRFEADGRYRSVEILSYPMAAGQFEFRRVQDGQLRPSTTNSHFSQVDPHEAEPVLRILRTTTFTGLSHSLLAGSDGVSAPGAFICTARTTLNSPWCASNEHPQPMEAHRGSRMVEPAGPHAIRRDRAGRAATCLVALAYSAASGSWQEAVRLEVADSNALQEDVRAVYGDEAPDALRMAFNDLQAVTLQPLGDTYRLAAAERETLLQTSFALRSASRPDGLIGDPRYQKSQGAYDVVHRLSDVRASRARVEDPMAISVEADRWALGAVTVALFTVALTGAAMAWAWRQPVRSQNHTARAGEPDLIPLPGAAAPALRRLTSILLLVWSAGIVFPLLQLALSAEEQRSQAAAARSAVRLTSDIAVSLTRSSFRTQARRAVAELEVRATAREIAALSGSSTNAAAERAVAHAELAAAVRLDDVIAEMTRDPAPNDHLDLRTQQALATTEVDWRTVANHQAQESIRAQRFGTWSNAALVCILLVLVAEPIVELHRHRQHVAWVPNASIQRKIAPR